MTFPTMLAKRPTIAGLCLICILTFVSVRSVAAHSGDHYTFIAEQPVGPYILEVWSYSNEPLAGNVLLEGKIVQAATGTPALGCDLVFAAVLQSNSLVATRVAADPATVETAFIYSGLLQLDTPGTYHVTATIVDPAGEIGDVGFDMVVKPPSLWLNIVIIIMLGLSLLAGLWLLKEAGHVWRRPAPTGGA